MSEVIATTVGKHTPRGLHRLQNSNVHNHLFTIFDLMHWRRN